MNAYGRITQAEASRRRAMVENNDDLFRELDGIAADLAIAHRRLDGLAFEGVTDMDEAADLLDKAAALVAKRRAVVEMGP